MKYRSLAEPCRRALPLAAALLVLGSGGCNTLQKAAQTGDVATVVKGLSAGKDVNMVDSHGRPLLSIAAERGQLPVIRELVARQADLEKKDSRDMTPLYIAAGHNQLAVVQELVAAGAVVDSRNTDLEMTPLLPAAEAGYKAVVEHLLSKGAQADARAKDGQTALSRLSRTHSKLSQSDNLGTAQLLLASVRAKAGGKGASAWVNQADSQGFTALHRAAGSNNTELLAWLLKNGANANALANVPADNLRSAIAPDVSPFATALEVSSGLMALLPKRPAKTDIAAANGAAPVLTPPAEVTRWTPLHSLALHCGAGEASLKALLAGGANARARAGDGRTALQLLADCEQGDPATVVKLLLGKARQKTPAAEFQQFLAEQGASGSSALINAVSRGHVETVRLLLAAGASPNLVGKDGRVALQIALANGNAGIIKHLLDARANPNLADGSGVLPLFMMVDKGDALAVQMLLAAGAKANVTDARQRSPLLAAVMGGNLEIVKALLAAKADPDYAPKGGEALLHVAMAADHGAMVAALLAAGADPDRLRRDGTSALYWAVRNGKAGMVQLLITHKAALNRKFNKASPLYWSVVDSRLDILRLLLTAKADPDSTYEGEEWTPLHKAANDGNTQAYQMLVEAGADRTRRNNLGKTADDLAQERAQRLAAEAEAQRQRDIEKKQNGLQLGKFAALSAGMALGGVGELDSGTQAELFMGAMRDSMGGQEGVSNFQQAANSASQRIASSSSTDYSGAYAGGASTGGGADWTPEPNVLAGSAACAGYTVDNYKTHYAGNSSGGDAQLHSLCAGAYNYYWMYLNAKKQGYSKQEAQRTYDVFLDAARTAESFYANNRSTGGIIPGPSTSSSASAATGYGASTPGRSGELGPSIPNGGGGGLDCYEVQQCWGSCNGSSNVGSCRQACSARSTCKVTPQ